jgi:hypothetical protein
MLSDMKSSVTNYANMKATPAKARAMSPIKEFATAEKSVEMTARSKKGVPLAEVTWEDVERATIKIQRQARVMLCCKSFRQCLYRLILLKSIV